MDNSTFCLRKGAREQEKDACKGKNCLKKKRRNKKNCWVNISHFHTDRFSFPRHRSRFSDSAVPTAIASVSLSHPSPCFPSGYKTDTNLLFSYIYIQSPSTIAVITKLFTKKYWTSFSLNQSVLHTKNGYRCLTEPFIRGPSNKLRMPLNHKQAKCRTRTLPGESTNFVVGSPFPTM